MKTAFMINGKKHILKYERKMKFNFQNKREFLIKISDIHFEIDMELLGCNAKLLWLSLIHI